MALSMARSETAPKPSPGVKREAFLRGGEDHVESPGVHFDLRAAERGNRVHEDEGLRRNRTDCLCDFLDGILHPGGGFVMDDCQGFESACSDGVSYPFGRGGRVPVEGEFFDQLPVGYSDLVPAVRKRAIDNRQHALVHEVADGGLLQARAGGRGQEDAVFCIEELLRLFRGTAIDGFEFLATVRKHGRGLRLQDFVGYINWTGNKHAGHKVSIIVGARCIVPLLQKRTR
ncbi:MAG: hypothetical protein MZV64_60360 [Ignavibacteriales bacterium]|nr:hypothetical protein [Ignavibacteriales bacterium]